MPVVVTDFVNAVQTWAEFVAQVRTMLPMDAARHGVQPFITAQIRQAVIEIQGLIPFYRVGHTTTYLAADFTDEGNASRGEMNNAMQISEALLQRVSDDADPVTVANEMSIVPWDNRHDLILGVSCLNENLPIIAVNPYGSEFLVYPKMETEPEDGSTWSVVLTWNGIKVNFENDDDAPFDEAMASAVADYVRAKIEREVNKDLNMSGSYMGTYLRNRTMLFVHSKDRHAVSRGARHGVSPRSGSTTAIVTSYAASARGVYGGSVEPNGNVSATGPAIYIQDDGAGNFVQQWSKPSGSTGNTGWV